MNQTVFFKRIPFSGDAFSIYSAWAAGFGTPGGVLLESARVSRNAGRFSIIAKEPYLALSEKNGRTLLRTPRGVKFVPENPFKVLKRLLADTKVSRKTPVPFCGGAIGYVSYEGRDLADPSLAGRILSGRDDLKLPKLHFLFFKHGIVLDHERRCAFLFSDKKESRAKLRRLERIVAGAATRRSAAPAARIASSQILIADTPKKEFVRIVTAAKRHIAKGDIYQANLAQRFSFSARETASQIYSRLRAVNPSPFFGLFETPEFQIISGSPERLVRVRGSSVDTRPIAGTRRRGRNRNEDRRLERELLLNEKEKAEHVMLVDLERNDLGRVCRYGSVRVDELMGVEKYSHVRHIVSNVRGELRRGKTALDVLAAVFPGGTITGAPKHRCMQIIGHLERFARGPYTGSMGYLSFNGDMDFNILIRSLVMKNGRCTLHAGAGIVADSDPEREYDETLHKAHAVFTALLGEEEAKRFFARCAAGR